MSTLFIIGAGASYGSGPCHPNNPAMGNKLLSELIKAKGEASKLKPSTIEVFERNFEMGMDEIYRNKEVNIVEFLRDMAYYFLNFEIKEGNVYLDLINKIKNKQCVIASTNYDLLIEQAISGLGLQFQYAGPPSISKNIPLLKIHGSCHFLPIVPDCLFDISFDFEPNSGAILVDSPIKPATSKEEVITFMDKHKKFAPALAIYHPKKEVLFCPEDIERQKAHFCLEIEKAKNIIIIGLSINKADEHIWGNLAKCKGTIYHIDPISNGILEWRDGVNKKNAYHIKKGFSDAMVDIKRIIR
ncbi:hypothetical protein JOE25_000544 [Serratia sp. PL17]|uniref:hypothetical protein n=1 Tax=Serratia sp. PL17 TaxID=2806582 RepID=UPI001AE5DA60|nr:hypothetical protein [Serratia sp. PL17]MBP1129001.1 hypothetical protein [Serratia sp. PL17]